MHTWHVNGDGSLCLMQAADDWQPEDTAADLVRKACGWFVEYLLVEAGRPRRDDRARDLPGQRSRRTLAAEYG